MRLSSLLLVLASAASAASADDQPGSDPSLQLLRRRLGKPTCGDTIHPICREECKGHCVFSSSFNEACCGPNACGDGVTAPGCPTSPCDGIVCGAGSTCEANTITNTYTCPCPDPTESDPCNEGNGGTCADGTDANFTCESCPDGYEVSVDDMSCDGKQQDSMRIFIELYVSVDIYFTHLPTISPYIQSSHRHQRVSQQSLRFRRGMYQHPRILHVHGHAGSHGHVQQLGSVLRIEWRMHA